MLRLLSWNSHPSQKLAKYRRVMMCMILWRTSLDGFWSRRFMQGKGRPWYLEFTSGCHIWNKASWISPWSKLQCSTYPMSWIDLSLLWPIVLPISLLHLFSLSLLRSSSSSVSPSLSHVSPSSISSSHSCIPSSPPSVSLSFASSSFTTVDQLCLHQSPIYIYFTDTNIKPRTPSLKMIFLQHQNLH